MTKQDDTPAQGAPTRELRAKVAEAIQLSDDNAIPEGYANGFDDFDWVSDWSLWIADRVLLSLGPSVAKEVASYVESGPVTEDEYRLAASLAERATRDAAERIIVSAMAWQPSENGPSYDGKLQELMARFDAACPSPAVNGWQPIETAPKNRPFIGRRGDAVYKTKAGRHYVKWPHEEGGPTFQDVWNRDLPGAVEPWEPTHWMTLDCPSQPETNKETD